MENFNKLVPIDGENGEKRTISSLQIAEITGKAYCGVLKVIRKMDIMCVKITMKNIFSLFVCLKKCCNFAVSNIFKGRWLSAHSRHFLCLYIILLQRYCGCYPRVEKLMLSQLPLRYVRQRERTAVFLSIMPKTSNNMAELVFQSSNGNDVTTSLIVAQVFGKEHKNVVRDIENLSCSENFNRLNFERITYKDARNREQTAYEMTKDGLSFLVMGYTGAKAGEFKEKFISEFNKRESLLKNDDYILMRSQQILQKRIEIAEEKIKCLEQQNSKLKPKADFADKAFAMEGKCDIGQAAKILGLPFGRNTLFKKLREAGVFFANRNEPKQKYIDAGYFEMREKPIPRENHPGFVVMVVLCTQKGLAYINHLFGGKRSDGKLMKIA